jgi:mRNA interferase RelE/StbE
VYRILLLPQAQKDLEDLQGKIFEQIMARMTVLRQDPRPPGSIKLTNEEGYRLKSGNYRIVYRIEDKEKKVYVYRIKHRKEAYR